MVQVQRPPYKTRTAAQWFAPRCDLAHRAANGPSGIYRGQLWMVANRHLPYEAPLADAFGEVRELDGTPGFKIIAARRPKKKPTRPHRR